MAIDPKARSRLRFGTLSGKVHDDVVRAFDEVGRNVTELQRQTDEHKALLASAASTRDLTRATDRMTLLEQQVAALMNQQQSLKQTVAKNVPPPTGGSGGGTGGGGGGGGGTSGTTGPTITGGIVLDGYPVTIYSSPDISGWPVTTTITSVQYIANGPGLLIDFDKKNGGTAWPNTAFGTGSIEYTIWFIELIAGGWKTAGGLLCWSDPTDVRGFGGPVLSDTQVGNNIYYNPTVWGPLAGFQPAAGSTVGLLVSAGQARASNVYIVQERSGIYWVTWPADGAPPVTFGTAPPP